MASDTFPRSGSTAPITKASSRFADPAFMDSEEFARFLAAETLRWSQAVKATGAKLDWQTQARPEHPGHTPSWCVWPKKATV